LDITGHRFSKPVGIKKIEIDKRSFLKLSFANNGLDGINLGNIIPSTITIKDGEMLNITAHIIAFPKPEMYWQFGQNGLCINVSSRITNSFNINIQSMTF
jgi:hypothetical protein